MGVEGRLKEFERVILYAVQLPLEYHMHIFQFLLEEKFNLNTLLVAVFRVPNSIGSKVLFYCKCHLLL